MADPKPDPKHVERAMRAIATEICVTDYTNGFCGGPRDGKCERGLAHMDCVKVARGCLQAMETVGVHPVWVFDKTTPPTKEGR